MKNEELLEKYPHVVPGSIDIVERGQMITGGKKNKIKSHGKICIIKCKNTNKNISYCLKTRIINIQDANQVHYCSTCTQYNRNARRRARRSLTK